MTETRRKYDVAYGCFLYIGLLNLFFMIAGFIPMGTQTAAIFGYIVGVPLGVVAIVALVVGIGYAISLRDHMPLGILSLSTIIYIIVLASQFGPPVLPTLLLILYIVITLNLICFLGKS